MMKINKEVYAFKNELYKDSSSGGFFFSAVKDIIVKYRDFNVYGAVFNSKLELKHCKSNDINIIKKMSGSKYVESNISGVLLQIENDLVNNKAVLFTGTPCQIAGVVRHCKNNNINTEKLFTVDLICHGVPENKYWNDFVNWISNRYKSKVTNVKFRKNGALNFEIEFENGNVVKNTKDLLVYFYIYNSSKIINDRCFSCKFAGMNNESDITMGDFWGIKECLPEFGFEKGVSLIIINTNKGKKLFENIIKTDGVVYQILNNDEYKKYNGSLIKPISNYEEKIEFQKRYKNWNSIYHKYLISLFFQKILNKIIKSLSKFKKHAKI